MLIAGETVMVIAPDGTRYRAQLSSVIGLVKSDGATGEATITAVHAVQAGPPEPAVHDEVAAARHAAQQAEMNADHYARMLREETTARLDAEARIEQLRADLAAIGNMVKSARQRARS